MDNTLTADTDRPRRGPSRPGPALAALRAIAVAVAAAGLASGLAVANAQAPPMRTPGQLDLRADCAAAGDGKADDSLALKSCLVRLQRALDAGRPTILRIGAGIYRITGAHGSMPMLERRGGTIQGDGPHASYLVLDPSYVGDLFSWSEAWIGRNYGPPAYDVFKDASGPTVSGLQITGSTAAKGRQTALAFYDRNDHVLLRDIEVSYLNGQCLSIGRTRRMPQAYMRESAFFNLKCWNTGAIDAPAVEIGSTTALGSDATNELDFYKVAIFAAPGDGLVVRNSNPFSATRRTRFFGLRVESVGGDAVVIGEASDRGQVADIAIHDLTVVQAGKAALRIGAGAQAPPPYQITVLGGALGPGDHTGIALDAGRLVEIDLSQVDGPVVTGPRASEYVKIHGNGSEADWRREDQRRLK